MAEARSGELIGLPKNGRTREALADDLINAAHQDEHVVVGLDFAFSFPSWFLEERDFNTAFELWAFTVEEGRRWLQDCAPPFWGRPGKKRPDLPEHFRKTEKEVARHALGRPL